MESCRGALAVVGLFVLCLRAAVAEVTSVTVCLMDNVCADIPQDLVIDFDERIFIYFYTGSTPYQYITTPLCDITRLLDNSHYDTSKNTVLYLHGFTETPWRTSVMTVVSAYLRRGDHNVLALDWSAATNRTYREAATLVPLAGAHVARALDALVRAGQPLRRLHVVGHSLGGQCAGHVGRRLATGRLPRIVALDPARPLFETGGAPQLRASDACSVAVLHTDGGVYGALCPTGSADFFPNGGSRYQPGCAPAPMPPCNDLSAIPDYSNPNQTVRQDFCSHSNSWKYYAASVLNEKAYPAVPCSSWVQFQMGMCPITSRNVVYMGFPDSYKAHGSYYLIAKPPC